MTLSELYLEAARVAKMIEGTELTMLDVVRVFGERVNDFVGFTKAPEFYTFALAIVEGKPVFKGDKLYYKDGSSYGWHPCCSNQDFGTSSWNQPKPKTVMVELLVEDVKYWDSIGTSAYQDESKYYTASGNFTQAVRKALGELK